MFETSRQSPFEPESRIEPAAYALEVPDFRFDRSISQAAFNPATGSNDTPVDLGIGTPAAGGIVDIRTLYLHNANLETHGWYSAHSRTAQLVGELKPRTGRIIVHKGNSDAVRDWASGFMLTDSGIMYTDRHAVINPGDQIDVTINGTKHQARLIADEQRKDTGLLQVMPNYEGEKFQPVRLESSNLAPGSSLIGMGFAKTSDDFSISPGTYVEDTQLANLGKMMENGRIPQGQDPSQQFKVFEANIQAGHSGELVVNPQTGGVIGAIGLALEGRYGYVITSEDIQDLLQRVAQTRPQVAGSDNGTGMLDRVDRQMPDWLRSPVSSMFGRPTPAPAGTPYYDDSGAQTQASSSWDYWRSRIKNWSFSDMFR